MEAERRSRDDARHAIADARSRLEARLAAARVARERLVARETALSWGRLAAFLIPAFGWIPFTSQWMAAAAVAIIGIITFAWVVRRHLRVQRERCGADLRLLVIDESLKRYGGEVELIRGWERPAGLPEDIRELPRMRDDAPTWALTQREIDDLDLFAAPIGIFGLLNRTSTQIGALELARWLEHPLLSAEAIERRQQAVRFLERDTDARIELMAALAALRIEHRALLGLIRAVQSARPLTGAGLGALRVWSVISGVLVAAMIGLSATAPVWVLPLAVLLAANFGAQIKYRARIHEALAPWQGLSVAMAAYHAAATEAKRRLPEEGALGDIRAALARVAQPSCLPSMARRAGWTEHGGFIGEALNAAVYYDLHMATAMLDRVLPHQEALLAGLAAIGELEAYLSLACFAAEQPVRCYPDPVRCATLQEMTGPNERKKPLPDGRGPAGTAFASGTSTADGVLVPDNDSKHTAAMLVIEGGVHPLVHPSRAVANRVALTQRQRIWVITGSNMSGKSTFIRMAGVSSVLAQVGGAVTAESMRWSPVRLMTNLRASDNLARNESYFLAEVRQLRRMVLPPAGGPPLLGLIDEPLRGTNSAEQTAASLAVLEYLLETPHLFILATHDRRLTELADGARAANYHFQENLSAEGMVFDYVLRDGPAQTRNALRFLEREGFPDGLVRSAQAWVGREGAAGR